LTKEAGMISFQVKHRNHERQANIILEIVIDPEKNILFFVDFSTHESGKFELKLPEGVPFDGTPSETYYNIVNEKVTTGNYKQLNSSEMNMVMRAVKQRIMDEVNNNELDDEEF
jgi:hypothetical protein